MRVALTRSSSWLILGVGRYERIRVPDCTSGFPGMVAGGAVSDCCDNSKRWFGWECGPRAHMQRYRPDHLLWSLVSGVLLERALDAHHRLGGTLVMAGGVTGSFVCCFPLGAAQAAKAGSEVVGGSGDYRPSFLVVGSLLCNQI